MVHYLKTLTIFYKTEIFFSTYEIIIKTKINFLGETVDMPHDRFRSTNSRSVVEYVPRTELDYGSLLCWATNSIGRQREPCIFHLVPGK